MKTISINLYEFKELSETAKEKARQWYLNDDFRSGRLTEDFEESYLKYFFPDSKLETQWSLSSCQGDGVNIHGELQLNDIISYIKKWNPDEHANYKSAYDPRNTFTDKELRRIEFYINHDHNSITSVNIPCNNHYCYCMANNIDFAEELIEDLECWNVSNIDKDLISRFQAEVICIVEGLCKQMEQYGYTYLYECEDEEVQEDCEANGWYFTEGGEFYSE